MKKLFYTYAFIYLAVSIIVEYAETSIMVSKVLFSISTASLLIPAIAPVLIIIYPKILKSHKEDQKYLNLNCAAAFFRILFMSLAPLGLRDHSILIMLNASGIFLYAFLFMDKIKYVPTEYIKEVEFD